jgi:hypothetical protein
VADRGLIREFGNDAKKVGVISISYGFSRCCSSIELIKRGRAFYVDANPFFNAAYNPFPSCSGKASPASVNIDVSERASFVPDFGFDDPAFFDA